jgi:hypothetical protein
MLVAIAATVFMWKLVILGGMSIDYFIAYLAFGTGNSGLNKFLDTRDTARTAQAKSILPKNISINNEDPSLRPPKG